MFNHFTFMQVNKNISGTKLIFAKNGNWHSRKYTENDKKSFLILKLHLLLGQ